MNEPALYLIPVPLGDTPIDQVLPRHNREVLASLRHLVVENVRSARRFVRKVLPEADIDSLTFYELGKHTDRDHIEAYLEPMARGESIGIISEAGCPAVADPGADLVAIAQRRGLRVVPLVGPSSMLMAVMASGLNGQSFAFAGYLPIGENERAGRLRQLEQRAWAEHQTQLCIETPYRNVSLMRTLLATLRPQTRLCLAQDITCADERITTRTVKEWRRLLPADATDAQMQQHVARVPSIFLFGV